MSDCTITCCETYVLWCCFCSVHCTVLYRVLVWIKDRGKGLTRSNKEHRASFFFGLREREFGNFGPRFAGVRNFLASAICFHMWGGKLASLERENPIPKKFGWAIFVIGVIQGTWYRVISGTSTRGVPRKFIWNKCLVVLIQIRWLLW